MVHTRSTPLVASTCLASRRGRSMSAMLLVLLLTACTVPQPFRQGPSGGAGGAGPGAGTSGSTPSGDRAGGPGRSGSAGGSGSTVPHGRPGEGAPMQPIPDRVITVSGRCAQTEEDGFREDATLVVRNNEVQSVNWQLWVGKRGSCTFRQADFRQTQFRPHIEMTANDGSGCKLMVWQDPRRITLAHTGCQRRCSPGIYEEAWPVMFDPASGACSKED